MMQKLTMCRVLCVFRCKVWLLAVLLVTVLSFRANLMAQEGIVYELVTGNEQLVDGGRYIIVDLKTKYALGWQDEKNDNRKGVSIVGKTEDNLIKGIPVAENASDHAGVYEFTLYKYNGSTKVQKWGFFDSVNRKFLCAHRLDRNGILLQAPDNSQVPSVAAATVTFNGQNVKIVFPENGKNSKKLSMGTYSNVFACYADGSPSLALYRKRIGGFSISTWGYTTYTNGLGYRMPQGCTGFVVSLSGIDGSGWLVLTERYKSGDVVPQNTPLLVNGTHGEYPLYHNVRKGTSLTDGENLLHGEFDEEGNVTYDIEHKEAHEYYKLTTKGGINFGFYWGADDGAPFCMSRTDRAYLVLPSNSQQEGLVKGLVLDEAQVETGVASPVKWTADAERTYDLSGRVCHWPLAPGIYIRAGRKFQVGK